MLYDSTTEGLERERLLAVRNQIQRDLESAVVTERHLQEMSPGDPDQGRLLDSQSLLLERCQQRLEFLQRQEERCQLRELRLREYGSALAAVEAHLNLIRPPSTPEPGESDSRRTHPSHRQHRWQDEVRLAAAEAGLTPEQIRSWTELGETGSPEPRPTPVPPPPPDEAGPLHAPKRQWHWLRRPVPE